MGSIKRNALHLLLGQMSGALFQAIQFLLVARSLGPHEFGRYSAVAAIVAILVRVALVGADAQMAAGVLCGEHPWPDVSEPAAVVPNERLSGEDVARAAGGTVERILEAAKDGGLTRTDEKVRPVSPMNERVPDTADHQRCPACRGSGWEQTVNPVTNARDTPCHKCEGKRIIPRPPGTYGPGVH